MAFGFDKLFGMHEQALYLRAKRSEVLANNISNTDTPGFKARDVDFKTILQQASKDSASAANLNTTNDGHIAGIGGNSHSPELLYRTPSQPSIDGNTVDSHIEKAKFAKNSIDFQASFTFLNSRITGLKKALKGQ